MHVVGGPAAVSDAVMERIGDHVPDVRRVHGATRYDTSAAVAREAVSRGADPAVVLAATGRAFPDALAAAAAVGALGGVVLLVDGRDATASPAALAFLAEHATTVTSLRLTGGTGAISEQTSARLAAQLGR